MFKNKLYSNFLLFAVVSLTSSILSLVIYHHFFTRPIINYYSGNDVKNISNSNLLDNIKTDGFSEIINLAISSVVYIQTIKNADFQQNIIESGSGVVLTSDGYIVTNAHVLKDNKNILVTNYLNQQFEAEFRGIDEATDLAVLKINVTNHPFLFIENSNLIEIGDIVFAIGNPFKLRNSVSMGIISAKNRSLNILGSNGVESYLQTDALANSGNSGGALIGTNGKMIGLISAVNSESDNKSGFSFAIPSNILKKVVFDLINHNSVQRARLGLRVSDVPSSFETKYRKGAFVNTTEIEGASQKAGIRKEDIIISVDSIIIENSAHFQSVIAEKKPGDIISLGIVRQNSIIKTTVTLTNFMNTTELISNRKDKEFSDLGLQVRNLTSLEKKNFSSNGVLVVSVLQDSKAAKCNMEPDYIIEELNGKKISSVDDLISNLKKSDKILKFNGIYKNYPGKFPYIIEK